MSRKPAPPKPEELIAKLDEKFEAFKEEITKTLEEKTSEIDQIKQKDDEFRQVLEKNQEEDKITRENSTRDLEKLLEIKLADIRRFRPEFLKTLTLFH